MGWYASSEDIKPNDVICVELSKRQSGNEQPQETFNESSCLLSIQTAGINMEKEFINRKEKK